MCAKVCFQMIVFQGMPFVEPVLESISGIAPIVVVEGPVAYWQSRGFTTSTDGTNDVIHQFVPSNMIVHGQWNEKDEQVNAGVHLVPKDTTHIFAIDADECWKSADLELILARLDNYDSIAFRPYSFYGGFERYMRGYEENSPPWGWQRIQRWYPGAKWKTHRPPTVLHQDGDPMRLHRHWSHEASSRFIRFFHYSYCLPRQTKDKTDYYSARAPEATIPNYMERIYLPWARGNDQAKRVIENRYHGVHNEKGRVARTIEFAGEHPESIQRRLPELRERFARELTEFK